LSVEVEFCRANGFFTSADGDFRNRRHKRCCKGDPVCKAGRDARQISKIPSENDTVFDQNPSPNPLLDTCEKNCSCIQSSLNDILGLSPVEEPQKIKVFEQSIYLKDIAPAFRTTFRYINSKSPYREHEIETAERVFTGWSNEPVFLAMEHQEKKPDGEMKKRRFCVRASKRGNDIYRQRLKNRFRKVIRLFPPLQDNHHSEDRTNMFFITNEYNENEITLGDSWENSSKDIHDYFCRLRKKHGSFLCIPTYSSLDNGYVHCHMIVVFLNKTFPIRKWKSTKGKNKGKWSWRLGDIVEKGKKINGKEVKNREFGDVWGHGYVDVLAFVDAQAMVDYALGYVTKEKRGNKKKRGNLLDTRSLTFNWMYGKRSFSVSNADVMHKCITETKRTHKVQINLEFEDIEAEFTKYIMLGLIVLDIPIKNDRPPPHYIEIDKNPTLKKDIFKVLRRRARISKHVNIQKV
jgi:hypothetical protein